MTTTCDSATSCSLSQPGWTYSGLVTEAASAHTSASISTAALPYGGTLSIDAGGQAPNGGVASASLDLIEDVLVTGGSGSGTFQSDWNLTFTGNSDDSAPTLDLTVIQNGVTTHQFWQTSGYISAFGVDFFPFQIPHYTVKTPFTFNVPFRIHATIKMMVGNSFGPGGYSTGTFLLNGFSTLDSQGKTLPSTIYDVTSGLGFFPITPCRIADTRVGQGKSGAFGPPALTAYSDRDFSLPSSTCNIPASAQAYSLNLTAIPPAALDFLSAWPTGQVYPGVSSLNSPDGSVIANAAIVPTGTNGSVTIAAGKSTDLIMDINGYFGPPNGQELAFYLISPCRVVDTRADQGKTGSFGPPSLSGYGNRDFPISGSCGMPNNAQAYSLNMTAVPHGRLDFLSTWPTGSLYPGVSTLNSVDGNVIANAAIVPSGVTGSITVVASGATDLIIDANGYFAATGSSGALHFYSVAPCRIADTRTGQNKSGAFGPPALAPYINRDFPISASACMIPTTAAAYSFNITAVPQGPLDFLSVWPTGEIFPNVSTLNSPKGTVMANAAIVPAGTNGSITVVAGKPTDVIIDINGYFAP